MKVVYTSLGFALGASAGLLPRDQCCFSLTASGGKSGVVGQLADGQNRVAQTGGLTTQSATYCLNNGGLTDQNGRGCILTPPTTQFQCDVGATATTGLSVNSNGGLTYNGNTQFWACATGDNGGYNIYTSTTGAQTGCVQITLNTGGKCAGSGGSSSGPAPSQPASSAPASSKPASSAPASSPATSKATQPAPTTSAPASSVPVTSQPGTGASTATPCVTSFFDGCNPAHSSCSQIGTFVTVTPSTYPTTYFIGCNPAHTTCPTGAGQFVTITSAPSQCASATNGGNTGSGSQPAPTGSGDTGSGSQPAPTGPQTKTFWSTTYYTVTSCGPSVSSCPAQSTVTHSASSPVVSQPGTTGPATTSGYACNPAHSYPGQTCISTGGSLTLVSKTSSQPATTAPGTPTASVGTPLSKTASNSASVGTPLSQTPSQSVPPSATTTSKSGGKCPLDLTPGQYEFPHLIEVNGVNGYNGKVDRQTSSTFTFDVPQADKGKTCKTYFTIPEKKDLETTDYTLTTVDGAKIDAARNGQQVNSFSPVPGNAYLLYSGDCAAGQQVKYTLSTGDSIELSWFNDYNPCPLGVFMTVA